MATPPATTVPAAKRKPVFTKVDQLKPGTNGHTLTVKVVSSKPVKTVGNKGPRSTMLLARPSRPSRIAECLIGDETGSIIFTARNEQGTILNHCALYFCFVFFFFLIPRIVLFCFVLYLLNKNKIPMSVWVSLCNRV